MSIYFGNDTVNDLYIGLIPVSKGYVGTHLFYNGDNTIIDLTYEKYILNTQFNTLYNTEEVPIKSAILKGNTKYRDIDTGDILDTFDKTKNLELVSVKMPVLMTTGKNLYRVGADDYANNSQISSDGKIITANNRSVTRNFIPLKPNTTYTFYSNCSKSTLMAIYGYTEAEESTFTRMIVNPNLIKRTTFTTNSSENFVRFRYNTNKDTILTYDIQLEEGDIATEYEPYKSNILTVNEEVELRGIGDVQDTLDLMTGELTERIGEVVLDGSEVWGLATTKEKTQVFELGLSVNQKINNAKPKGLMMCDKIKIASGIDDEIIVLTTSLYLGLLKTKASTIEELNVYLSQNPITIQYETKNESVKTVDLSVVDQDGNNTKLSTFNDITHVTLSSEGLIPEAELEVATKNEEVLNTMSLEMDDISTTQNALQETSNTQSENVDATMLATTEIYEGLL